MSDLRGNMIIGTVLASFLGVLGIREAANAVYDTHYPKTPGYAVEIPETPAGGAAPEAPKPIDWGVVLADASQVAKGEKIHGQCVSCHTFEAGGANGTGPNLWEVVGRVSGTYPGFTYSAAMVEHAKPWTYDELAAFLAAPARHIPGTKMSYAGLRRQDDQAAAVAYLRSLSANPAPIPAPLPAEAPAAPAAGEGGEAAAPPAEPAKQ